MSTTVTFTDTTINIVTSTTINTEATAMMANTSTVSEETSVFPMLAKDFDAFLVTATL